MERQINIPTSNDRDAFIKAMYAEKKGRDISSKSIFTCYINIDTPTPNLPRLTASMLEELSKNRYEAFAWALRWDKSIISIAPDNKLGCVFLRDDDLKGKVFVPVSTTRIMDTSPLVKMMPEGNLGMICINNQPTTVDAFLIVYFHMVNELIWDNAIAFQGGGRLEVNSYAKSINEVIEKGFSIQLVSEEDLIQTKRKNTKASIRIYGSNSNLYVPQIMGAVIRT